VWRQVHLGQKMVLLYFASSVTSSNIFKCDVYSTEKVVKYQNRPDLRSRLTNEIFSAEKKTNKRENSCTQQLPSSRINVVCTNDRFIMNANKNCQKKE
jgi:hypothetical protein